MFFGQLYKFLVVNTACTNQNHAIRSIVGLDVIREIIPLDGQNVGFGTKNCAAEGLTYGMLVIA